jgi:hypothetical protein
MQLLNRVKSQTGPGEVANETEPKKTEKYAELATQYQFVPIAIETLGPVGAAATSFFKNWVVTL